MGEGHQVRGHQGGLGQTAVALQACLIRQQEQAHARVASLADVPGQALMPADCPVS